jgi:hypothetical protein
MMYNIYTRYRQIKDRYTVDQYGYKRIDDN